MTQTNSEQAKPKIHVDYDIAKGIAFRYIPPKTTSTKSYPAIWEISRTQGIVAVITIPSMFVNQWFQGIGLAKPSDLDIEGNVKSFDTLLCAHLTWFLSSQLMPVSILPKLVGPEGEVSPPENRLLLRPIEVSPLVELHTLYARDELDSEMCCMSKEQEEWESEIFLRVVVEVTDWKAVDTIQTEDSIASVI